MRSSLERKVRIVITMVSMLPILSLPPSPSTSLRKWRGTFIPEVYRQRRYKLYLPYNYRNDEPVPLLVMLHGCTQDADDFALGTEMNRFADHYHCMLVYPEQPRSANRGKCWNWFSPKHQARGRGEPAEIVAIVDQVKTSYVIDDDRVYAVGISAGAAMAVILGATYPDVFAALGISSGVPYKASTGVLNSLKVMSEGTTDPSAQGHAAYVAMGPYKRIMPVIVFHGTADPTVTPKNADDVIAQWLQTNRLAHPSIDGDESLDDVPSAVIPGQAPEGRTFTESIYRDRSGKIFMKKIMVDGMKHGWSGGSLDGTFTDPAGPKASQMIIEFLLDHALHQKRPVVEGRRSTAKVRQPAQVWHRPRVAQEELIPRWFKRIGAAVSRLVRRGK